MYVSHLTLHDFRSYADVDVELGAGVSAFVGRNGQGKTNLVEAVDYLSRLQSHRVATDAPLVRVGADRALVRAAVVRDGRTAILEVELVPGKANRARVNRSPLPRARELVGLVRTVVFAPEDLALVKGDPTERRRYLDDLLVLRTPRLAGVRADYERVLRQRNSLLKTARSGARTEGALATLDVWDDHLARTGGEILHERLRLVSGLGPYATRAYAAVAEGAESGRVEVGLDYRSSVVDSLAGSGPDGEPGSDVDPAPAGGLDEAPPDRDALTAALLAELARRRTEEVERGVSLVGPHRDDLVLSIGTSAQRLPARGYASHGESWSLALALRLAAYDLLRADGDDPILILDDVFAELDADRRHRLAALVADSEQVLVTAAVDDDIPAALAGARFTVAGGEVTRADA